MQVVLGVYVATFVYSLLVLRVIRTPESEGATFDPVISVTVAIVLALVCVALLIFFIHHIANLIQSSTIVLRAQEDTMGTLANLHDLEADSPPEAEDPEDRPDLADLLARDPLVLRARESGYVQYLDVDRLVYAVTGRAADGGAADGTTTVVEIPFGPGIFVAAGLPVVRVWPARGLSSEDEMHDALVFGKERSPSDRTSPSASVSSRT